jgi:histidine decarboxylase
MSAIVAASDVAARLATLERDLIGARHFDIGFPGAVDLEFPELADLMCGQLLNNIGDPRDPGHGRNHTKGFELEVVDLVADWLHAPEGRWGYVTSGASEGTEHALDEAWQTYRDVVVYASAAVHYSVIKAVRRQKLSLVQVATEPGGRMDLADLHAELRLRRDRPAAIVATVGTTMTEAIDDVAGITAVCDRLAISRRRIHVDAALSGIPLALLPDGQRPAFDFAAGATSIVVSGHKFLGTGHPCGVLVYAESPYVRAGRTVPYTGSLDTTVLGSRSGHTPLLLWLSLMRLGADGHRARATAARNLAEYTCGRLTELGWNAWRHEHAFTVVLDRPPAAVTSRWVLADDGYRAHLITMPGVTQTQIDDFITDLATTRPHTAGPASRRASTLATLLGKAPS